MKIKPGHFLFVAPLGLLLASAVCHADISTCNGVYVGMVSVEVGQHLTGVTFHNSPTDTSGSNWQYFANWSVDEKKAVLVAAKVSQHRVNVTTTGGGDCSITTGWHQVKSVVFAAAP